MQVKLSWKININQFGTQHIMSRNLYQSRCLYIIYVSLNLASNLRENNAFFVNYLPELILYSRLDLELQSPMEYIYLYMYCTPEPCVEQNLNETCFICFF